jgi:hypothetical protein
MVLFSQLFGDGRAVTAVGDPHQSIYGFRGASAGQLGTFRDQFPLFLPDGSRALAPVANLSVAWRNSTSILATANTVSAPLNTTAPWLKHQRLPHVPELQAKPQAPLGEVYLGRYLADVSVPGTADAEDIPGEADAVAEQGTAPAVQPVERVTVDLAAARAAPQRLRLDLHDVDEVGEVGPEPVDPPGGDDADTELETGRRGHVSRRIRGSARAGWASPRASR